MSDHETDAATPTVLISEAENRHNLIGVDVVNRETGETETTISFSKDEIDLPGYVEHVEKGYDGTQWSTVRVWRTTIQPGEVEAALAAVGAYVGLVERIHEVYRNLVMDTDKDRALHARHVENADRALALVKTRLRLGTNNG